MIVVDNPDVAELDAVFDDLSEQTLAELDQDPADVRNFFKAHWDDDQLRYAIVAENGRTVAVVGVVRLPDMALTFSYYSRAFWRYPIKGAKALKEALRRAAETWSDTHIGCAIGVGNPDAERWVRLLGFEFLRKVDGLSVFRLIPRT